MANELTTTTNNHTPAKAVPLADMERMAHAIAKSGLFGTNRVEQALALMLMAQAEGMHPAIAARDYDIIQGKPSKKTEAMLRDFLQAGGKVEWLRLDDQVAEAKFSHASGGSVTMKWDMQRAKQAGLGGKDMWRKYPRQMLRSRCVSEGIRTVFPMATGGMYVPEEVSDFDNRRDEDQTIRTRQIESTSSSTDSDGRVMDEATIKAHVEAISAVESLTELKKVYSKAYVEARDIGDGRAMSRLEEAKDQAKARVENKGNGGPGRLRSMIADDDAATPDQPQDEPVTAPADDDTTSEEDTI